MLSVKAEAGDVIVIAGKGHETYQLVGDQVLHFDDREEATKAYYRTNKFIVNCVRNEGVRTC